MVDPPLVDVWQKVSKELGFFQQSIFLLTGEFFPRSAVVAQIIARQNEIGPSLTAVFHENKLEAI